MKKWMLVYNYEDGRTIAMFFDEYIDARNTAMNVECGLDLYWELYERKEVEDVGGYKSFEYVLAEA